MEEVYKIYRQLYNTGDYCLNTSLYYASKIMLGNVTEVDKYLYEGMKNECWLYRIVWNRKSQSYKWSNSGAEAKSENTLFNRPTKWIYDHLLKYFKIDPFKGLSIDQIRSYCLSIYMCGDWEGALRIKIGFLIRLGLSPSLCEFAIAKPQSFVLLFKTKYPYYINLLWYPIYLICKLFFYFSYTRELKVPIEKSTTNKITLLPTAKMLGYKLPEHDYIKRVYKTYFGENIIGKTLMEAL